MLALVASTEIASAAPTEANGRSSSPSVSVDGRFLAFGSASTNLVSGDTNGVEDIFVRDRGTGATLRVSMSSGGAQANGNSYNPAISSNGNFVAFESDASNVVGGDTNGTRDIFRRDRSTGTTILVSVSSGGAIGNGLSSGAAISSDGRYVAFSSSASNLVSGDTNAAGDIFIRDVTAGTTTRLSVNSGGAQANGASSTPAISANGRYVAFTSWASNLVTGDTNNGYDVFVRDTSAGTTTRESVGAGGAQGNAWASFNPSISSDGRFVAFSSQATNLVTGDTNGLTDVFVRDRTAATTSRVSVSSSGGQATGGSSYAPVTNSWISHDGRFVVFQSDATNLVSGDSNGVRDVFERDRTTGSTRRMSFDDWKGQGNARSTSGAISGDGSTAAYMSDATNLLAFIDANQVTDILIHVFDFARTFCFLGKASVPDFGSQATLTQPEAGQTVYRVWGGGAREDGGSWTPVDPRTLGPDQFRIEAGLPDRLNDGTTLTIGVLRDASKVNQVRASLPVNPLQDPAPGPAYRSYPGGLVEYVILDVPGAIDILSRVPQNPAYGGPPAGCTPSIPPARGCVGER
ncbi:MAG TPA: hypothetical protein VF045_01785 [Acidimicrobiales bacterium]